MDGMVGIALGLLFGILIGMLVVDNRWRNEAVERGFMVQCVGQEGWYWECDK